MSYINGKITVSPIMKINPLFKENELINLQTYLSKCGIEDVAEYIKGGSKGIEPPDRYENMENGYRLLMEIIKEK